MRIARVAVRDARSRVQSSVDHLMPTPFSRKDRKSMPTLLSGGKLAERRKHVPPRQRVPFWNLAVGDTVRVLAGDSALKHKLGRIKDLDRHRNVVWLADRALSRERASQGEDRMKLASTRPIHYSNVQLVLGNYDIEPKPSADRADTVEPGVARLGRRLEDKDPATSLSRTVVATRLRATNVRWVGRRRAFVWDRLPVAVRALRPDGKAYEAYRIDVPTAPLSPEALAADPTAHALGHVPWPIDVADAEAATSDSRTEPVAGPYDTLPSATLRMTWSPSDLMGVIEPPAGEAAANAAATATVEGEKKPAQTLMWQSGAALRQHVPELQVSRFEFSNPEAAKRRQRRELSAVLYSARRQTRRTAAGRLLDDFRQSTRKGWLRAWRGRTDTQAAPARP